ncbi:MAG: HEAT repeat domain-containing protein [Candidatus Electrothrix sp. AR3]|nr:HEAT repeat domain-containing protein [Candidatus Electrothrix sp. AR3]
MGVRKIKQHVLKLLRSPEFRLIQKELTCFPLKDVINALIPVICRDEEQVRWFAVSALGVAVAQLANEEMEAARIIMRRLLWSLNDESGGIGWGAPEAMAEIMSCHEGLAEEYIHMLLSYMRPDGEDLYQEGNFLEHERLQQGLMWAAGRMAQSRRQLALTKGMDQDLPPYLASSDATVRGLAVRALGLLEQAVSLDEQLRALTEDNSRIRLYEDGNIKTVAVADLAMQAVERLKK